MRHGFGSSNDATGILFIIGIVVVAILIGCSLAADVSGHTREVAQREADAFVSGMKPRPTPRCADRDTDGDGYVSCPLVFEDGHVQALECAGSLTINSGCRPPKAVIRAQE